MNTFTANRARTHRRTLLLTEWIKAEEGGWVVGVWGFPGCVTQGATEEEAEWMIRDAYEGLVESYDAFGEEIPWKYEPREGWELRWVSW